MSVRILVGDCLDLLRTLPEESVHCVVTSPPYWGLRDYGVQGAIGLEPTFGEHLDALVRVFREVRRVLRKATYRRGSDRSRPGKRPTYDCDARRPKCYSRATGGAD